MAEMLLGSLVDALVSTTVDGLKQMAQDEVTLLLGVPDEIEKLSTTFASIQTMLADAEAKRFKDKKVNIWFETVKEVVHDVDDIVDDWRTEALIKSQKADNEEHSLCKNKVQSCFSPPTCFTRIMFRHNIGNRIKKARKRLSEIAEETRQLGLIGQGKLAEKTESQVKQEMINQRETSSLVDNIHSIVGREGDKKAVLEFLIKESSGEVPLVGAIVGMGGLGKTTLAQLVYNDQTVGSHFEKRMWVCVSDDFDVKRITKSIIESAEKGACVPLDLDTLQNRLKDLLQAKRFLLVLDDIWSEDSGLWEKLQSPLRAGAMGSRILITTRKETVASAVRSSHVHKLEALTNDECWSLFSHTALSHRNEAERSELEGVGRDIVSKCGGLPLAAKTIGSMVRPKRTKQEWELVLRSEMWNSQEMLGGILPALLLSYYDLQPHLKQCFAYCSLFPKDYSLDKDVVVMSWMAQGFIQCNESEDMEETGELYFDDLVRRSLIHVERGEYKMHDLIHDVAQRVAGSECCSSAVDISKPSSSGNLRKLRHVFLSDNDDDVSSASVVTLPKQAHKLRTLVMMTGNPPKLSDLRYVRFLLFQCKDGHVELLHTLGQLKHLRYLFVVVDYTSNGFELPGEVCNCVNLQVLGAEGFRPPRQIGKLINLRHLDFNDVSYWPRGIGRLTRLRTLEEFPVGGSSMEAKGASCGCEELKHLNNLRGKLKLTCLENVRSAEKAKEAQMHKKLYIRHLVLAYSYSYAAGDEDERRAADVVEELKPHPKLENFKLSNYKGCKFPSWLGHPMFRDLVKVVLYDCSRCQWLPPLGSLPSLKEVDIQGMKEVRYVGSEFCGGGDDSSSNGSSNVEGECLEVSFPKLQQLTFSDMSNWEEWELEIPTKKRKKNGLFFPSLLLLRIEDCPKLKAVRFDLLPDLEELYLLGDQDGLFCQGPLPAHPNLRKLKISDIGRRSQLPDGWLGQFKALQHLYIRSCSSLMHLPNEVQTLAGLRRLTIYRCPLLEERCKEGGEEWPKISHIQTLEIG